MNKYHMRKIEREITDKEELANILRNGKCAVIYSYRVLLCQTFSDN